MIWLPNLPCGGGWIYLSRLTCCSIQIWKHPWFHDDDCWHGNTDDITRDQDQLVWLFKRHNSGSQSDTSTQRSSNSNSDWRTSNKYLSHCIVSRYYDLVYLVALGAEPLPKLLKFSNLQLPPTTSFLSARTAGTTSGEKLCMHNCKYLVQQLLVG